MRASAMLVAVSLAVAGGVGAAAVTTPPADEAVLWSEPQREFLQDGPGLLLSDAERAALEAMSGPERSAFIAAFLAQDPLPETPRNELGEGITRRRRLVLDEFSTFADDRARVLFLHGRPAERTRIECGETFVPIEVWWYSGSPLRLLFYRPVASRSYRLWVPLDSKRVLYNREMEYWLEQYEELRNRIRSRRFDLLTCSETRMVDEVTGVEGLTGYRDNRPRNAELLAFLAPPGDLAGWARAAAATEAADEPSKLRPELEILFPARQQQRIVTRLLLTLPAGTPLGTIADESGPEHRVTVSVLLEHEGTVFDEFRVRFRLPPGSEVLPRAMTLERPLRPGRSYLARLLVTDEVDGAVTRLARGFLVPAEPREVDEPPVPEGVVVALGEELQGRRLAGKDSLLLVPPEDAVVVGVWRAETLVSGDRIARVVFSVDGDEQLVKTRPPFTAELRLAQFPTEQVVRAAGFDAAGQLVAADEVVLNQPRGAFKVRILDPARGAVVEGRVSARVEVVVPDERRVVKVEFFVNEELRGTRSQVPWQVDLEVSQSDEMSYLTVVATLDDGSRSEAVRFLNAPRFLEEVQVDLVEVLTTVVDRSNRPVADLGREEFRVFEDGREQRIEKFERVENLPLAVGFAVDTSGSMEMALPEAQKAAVGLLENLITPRDTVFAVGFADEPVLLIPPTDDVAAVGEALQDLQSLGWTALHDAIVTSLYYFRGVRGRRALILLSDGDDSSSYYPFRDALEYARRSGVAIYTVGIGVSTFKQGIRRKLGELAEETGGRVFFIERAEELIGVYRTIENELRSQYLITYSSDGDPSARAFRTIEVKLRSGRLKARAARGYYPN